MSPANEHNHGNACWTLECDVCEKTLEADMIPHFDSKEEALHALVDYDWRSEHSYGVSEGEKVWCPDCEYRVVCKSCGNPHEDHGDQGTGDCSQWEFSTKGVHPSQEKATR